MWAAAKDGLETFAALAICRTRIVPGVRRELGEWRRVAAVNPGP